MRKEIIILFKKKDKLKANHRAVITFLCSSPYSTVEEISCGTGLESSEVASILSEDPVVRKRYPIGYNNDEVKFYYSVGQP